MNDAHDNEAADKATHDAIKARMDEEEVRWHADLPRKRQCWELELNVMGWVTGGETCQQKTSS